MQLLQSDGTCLGEVYFYLAQDNPGVSVFAYWGELGFQNVPALHPVCNYKSSDLNNVLVCPWVLYLLFKTTSLVLLTGGVVEYLT